MLTDTFLVNYKEGFMDIRLNTPLTREDTAKLTAGDYVYLSGTIYTARDAAHKRMLEEYDKTKKFPFDIQNQIVYYAGPAPAKPSQVIGSVGPTTSYRMDAYSPELLKFGLRGMIGKGMRDKNVIEAMKQYGGVYFGATGGAGALLANHVLKSDIVAYEDLGAEAIRKLVVKDFPVIVIIDSYGNNLYETEYLKYKK